MKIRPSRKELMSINQRDSDFDTVQRPNAFLGTLEVEKHEIKEKALPTDKVLHTKKNDTKPTKKVKSIGTRIPKAEMKKICKRTGLQLE